MTAAWTLEVCIHGVREEPDGHPCPECQKIAASLGWEVVPGIATYIFTEDWVRRNKKKFPELLPNE
jgi:hypothetical protein